MPLLVEEICNRCLYLVQNQHRNCNSHHLMTEKDFQQQGPYVSLHSTAATQDIRLFILVEVLFIPTSSWAAIRLLFILDGGFCSVCDIVCALQ